MNDYQNQRKWSDKFIPEIKRIVGYHLLEISTLEQDTKQATDLIILNGRDKRIAARMRKQKYENRYPHDITIRSKIEGSNGHSVETEFSKLVAGYGDWMFYGFSKDDVSGEISRWYLIDLNKWRLVLLKMGYLNKLQEFYRKNERSNFDGTYFIPFNLKNMPQIVIASSHLNELTAQNTLFGINENRQVLH